MTMTRQQLFWYLTICSILLAPSIVLGDWPQFRGPWGMGIASAPGDAKPLGLPLNWSETENVTWKTAIPHRGWSTPVVMDGRVWLTTATIEGHDFFVICLDASSGQVLLNRRLFHTDNPEPLGNDVNCYASPSPVVEPGRVYISFGSYGTACLDTTTHKELWRRTDIPCRHYRGPGSSPILFENLLIITLDGVDLQYVIALDKKTGQTIWKTDRTANWDDLDDDGKPHSEGDLRKAFSTPIIVKVNGKTQMISAGSKAAYGYDPATGHELWKVRHIDYTSATSPLFAKGTTYILTGFGRAEMFAIDATGTGDVTDSNVLWKIRRNMPRTPSPLLIGDIIYTLADNGVVSCLEAATGEQIWRQRIEGDYASSLLYADERIYCFSRDGVATVLKAGRTFEALSTNTLDSGFMASPAASDGALFLRTKTHVYKIEASKSK